MDLPKCWSDEIKIIKQWYNLEKYSDEEIGHLTKYRWKQNSGTNNKSKATN